MLYWHLHWSLGRLQFVDLNRQEVTKEEEEEEGEKAEVSCVDGDEGGSIRRDMKASEYTSISVKGRGDDAVCPYVKLR